MTAVLVWFQQRLAEMWGKRQKEGGREIVRETLEGEGNTVRQRLMEER